MIDTAARASVKRRLDIDSSNSTFDNMIDEFVLYGVKRLYPIAQREIAVQTIVATVDSFGEALLDLSTLTTPCLSVRKVEYQTPEGVWIGTPDKLHHGTTLMLRDLPSDAKNFRIYGITSFDLASVPDYLELAVIWYAMSEFYDNLAGNNSKYNLYMQSGARDVDNMNAEAVNYEQKANTYLNDRVQLYGSL